MKLGFIGTGAMGSRMAANLLKAGHQLAVYDVRREQAEPLLTQGAEWADGPLKIARISEVVMTSLPGPAQVEAVALGKEGILAGLGAGNILVDLSTNSLSTVRKVYGEGKQRGVHVLDAPVSGGVAGAQSGQLAVMVSGDPEPFERCKPALQAIGSNIIYCGDIGAGTVCKLVNNLLALSANTIAAEVLTLGVKAGVPLATLLDVISKSSGKMPKLEQSWPRSVFKGNFAPGFALDLAVKDMNLGLGLAREIGLPLDFMNLAFNRFVQCQARGWGKEHSDAVVKLFEEIAGVELRLPAQ